MHERFGSYVISEELGAGGLASVHLAKSPAIQNPVALKRLYPHVSNIRELVGSFIDEARLARRLRHPGIARIYEFGRIRGTYFIAFEFVPGPTLQQLQRHCAAHIGRVPIPVVLAIADQLCDALDHAHNLRDELGLHLGIVHRDVSPSNVIVSSTGQVKLIDFGLAKTKQSSVQSQAGVIKGKLSYVAPEYLSGKLDSRCDLWALGVCLHELLTNQRLFDAPDHAVTLDRVRAMPIPPPSRHNPDVPRDVDDIILKMLERNPDRRWQNAATIRAAIANVGVPKLSQKQLVAWVEWAFSQKQPEPLQEESAVSALGEILESRQIEIVGELPALSEAMLERRRESIAAMPFGAAMIERHSSRRWWLVLLVLVILGAGAAMVARSQGML